MLKHSPRRERGSAILIVLVISFIISTLIVAIFMTQGATRQALLRSHNELQARQVMRFELANMALGKSAPKTPDWLEVDIKKKVDQSEFLTDSFASNPYGEQVDLNEAIQIFGLKELEGFAGHRYLQYELPAGPPVLAVTSENLGFALLAFATGGIGESIELSSLRSWKNPAWGTANAESEYSGTPPNIFAAGPVSIEDFPYGNIYQTGLRGDSNNIGPADGSAASIVFNSNEEFRGVTGLNPIEYRKLLEEQIANVTDELTDTAKRSNRTPLINEEIKIADTLGMFFSQAAAPRELKERLTLREAQGYWLPGIPTFKPQFSAIYHLIIHSPARPDGNLDNDFAKIAQKVLTAIIEAVALLDKVTEALEKLKKEVQKLRKEIDKICKCGAAPNTWHCCAARAAAWTAYYAALAALEAAKYPVDLAKNAIMALVSPVTLALEAILAASGQIEPPKTRNEEKNFERDHGVKLSKEGMAYWAYRAAFEGVFKVVANAFAGRFDKIGESLGNRVTLVFFGQPNKAQNFHFPNAKAVFVSHATWNVPPGRTFYYNTSLEIHGDLWLSQGSTMVVKGDLTLLPGDKTPGQKKHPAGTLHLEQGSNLVVDGDFSARGEWGRGSVLVCGSLGSLNGISSAVLAEGHVNLPNGVVPAVALSKLKPTQTIMKPMVDEVAPNLSKSAGPFHSRLPYIAMYATTFQWIVPLKIPFIIPMNFPNFHVPIFRGFSHLYAPTLNLEMGENLLTHCDWWGTGGEGRAPTLTKPESSALLEVSPVTQVPAVATNAATSAVDKRISMVGAKEVNKWSNALLIGLLKEWSNALALETGIPMVKVSTIASAVLKKFFKTYYNLDKRETDLENALPKARPELTRQMTQLWSQVDQVWGRNNERRTLAQECQGALIYAGGDLTVGSGEDPLSAGLFIADGALKLRSQLTIGSAISFHNGIEAKDFLFYPAFTQASLFRPLEESPDWTTRARAFRYGAKMNDNRQSSSKTLTIGAWRSRLTTVARGQR